MKNQTQNFTATVEKKYMVWQRITFEVNAGSKEEAEKIIAENNGLPENVMFQNVETLTETEEAMTPETNKGQPVWELKNIE